MNTVEMTQKKIDMLNRIKEHLTKRLIVLEERKVRLEKELEVNKLEVTKKVK